MKVSEIIFILVITTIAGIAIKYSLPPIPQYRVGECSKDLIHGDVRKIEKVDLYVYNYCKIVDNKCDRKYFMRIKDFDRIMVKIKCPEDKNE